MLDNEPDNNDINPAPAGDESAPASPAPRRRRAATRQAGPPSAAPEPTQQPPVSAQEPSQPTEEHPEPAQDQAKPAKKTARKRAAKAADATTTRTPRKRAAKKAAASPPTDDGSSGEGHVAVQAAEASGAEQPGAEPPGAEQPGAEQSGAEQPVPVEPAATIDRGEPTSDAPAGRDTEPTPEAAPDAESALDEIRLALSAELPPREPTDESDDAAAEAADESDDASDAGDSDTDDSDTDDSDDDSADDDSSEESSTEEDDEGGTPRRRRRRRGGRRRRRGGGSDSDGGESADSDQRQGDDQQRSEVTDDPHQADARAKRPQTKAGQDDQAKDGQTKDDQTKKDDQAKKDDQTKDDRAKDDQAKGDDQNDDAQDDGADEGGQRRRRRRRRRRGEDSGPAADDPAEVVVRVREPRSRRQAAQEVTGIEGSTRMEAKRQRRREGREAGRRRAPILSEAEFLARRESVVRKMVIRQRDELSQIAVLEDDILVEHYVDRESAASLIGNVYLGRVQNVLPSMEAAFIDIGRGRNAVLYAGEVDWDAFGANGQQRKVENVLKSGQTVLVQVTKDPVGAKGARLTSHITLPGRYIVYAPGGHLSGISRKLPDNERKRLKSILNDLVPESASVIVRTAAEGSSEDELTRDVNRLKAQWEDIERKVKQGSAPKLLYGEPDLTVRIVRDLFTEDFAELTIQGNGSQTDAYDAVDAYVGHVAPHLHDRMRRWDAEADGDLFAKYRLDEQIAKALERKVFLPSGGSLIIDRTEAMTVIDVNTGKFTGSGGNLEATVTSNNLEAAEEIVRQLRLRDIGGIIVIDFIDMVLPSNRELLLRRLVECLGRDRTRHQVAEVTSLGLVQMTRKKIGTGLLEAFTTECEHCHGRGYEISEVPVETQKQPDGGSRDQRGGGGRGRGRNNQSGGNAGSTNPPKPQHQPIPAALRPDHGAKPQTSDGQAADQQATDQQATDQQATDQQASDQQAADQQANDQQASDQQAADQQAIDQQATDQSDERANQPEAEPAT